MYSGDELYGDEVTSPREDGSDVIRPRPAIDYTSLPEHMQDGTRLYVERGIEPGDFTLAVLCDSLTGSFAHADLINARNMRDWATWLWNDAPAGCWGSLDKVKAWIEKGGLQGRAR
jgi:uncharacterized membrane protein